MKTIDLQKEGFTELAFRTTHQLNSKKMRLLRSIKVDYATRATTNFITEYYTRDKESAEILYKVSTNQI